MGPTLVAGPVGDVAPNARVRDYDEPGDVVKYSGYDRVRVEA